MFWYVIYTMYSKAELTLAMLLWITNLILFILFTDKPIFTRRVHESWHRCSCRQQYTVFDGKVKSVRCVAPMLDVIMGAWWWMQYFQDIISSITIQITDHWFWEHFIEKSLNFAFEVLFLLLGGGVATPWAQTFLQHCLCALDTLDTEMEKYKEKHGFLSISKAVFCVQFKSKI